MPTIEQSQAAFRERVDSGDLTPAVAENPPVIPSAPIPDYPMAPNPFQRGPLPASMSMQPDTQRQWHSSMSPQSRVSPVPPMANPNIGATAASQAVTVVQTGKGTSLKTNNISNNVQSELNLIAGSNVTLSAGAQGQVTVDASGGGDGLVHGDAIWAIDPAYVILRDEFQLQENDSATADAAIVGSLGWRFTGATNAASYGNGFDLSHVGEFAWEPSGTLNQIASLSLQPLQNYSSSMGQFAWPLLDYPGWKAIFIWRFRRDDTSANPNTTAAISFTKKTMYVGFGFNNRNMRGATVGSGQWLRPPIFMGARFDKDPTAPAISDSTIKLEIVENTVPTGTTQTRDNTAGTVVDTLITPTEDFYYRLDIQCVAAGVVTMSINGAAPSTFTFSPITITSGNAGQSVESGNGLGILDVGTNSTPGTLVFGPGSIITVAGLTGGNTALNGTFTDFTNGGVASTALTNHRLIIPVAGTIGSNSPTGWTITGYPAFMPIIMFGNDSEAAPGRDCRISVDYFAFVWNKGLATGAPAVDATKARYF